MKIKMLANEIVDGEVDYVSLVKNGANRSPFKLVKSDDQATDFWAGLMPDLEILERRLANSNQSLRKENTVTTKQAEPDTRERDLASLRQRLARLYSQQQSNWESPQSPLFQKFDDELSFEIERTESELRVLRSDDVQMQNNSAFFRRGGTSQNIGATASDSAYERCASLCKAEGQIDLSDNGLNPNTDPDEVAKIDLGNLKL